MPDGLNAITPKITEQAGTMVTGWGKGMPTPQQWKSSSSVWLSSRNSDPVLTRIDHWVSEAASGQGTMDRKVLLSFLYYAIDQWLALAGAGFQGKAQPLLGAADINTSRLTAVYALYIATVNELCAELTKGFFGGAYGVTPNSLPEYLEQMFGKDILPKKLKQDVWKGDANYISVAERLKYRLQFKRGLAYMTNWYEPGTATKLVLAESSRCAAVGKEFYPPMIAPAETGWAGFVMSMGREIYMAKHLTAQGMHASFFHSSYMGGQGVLCAGTIKIVQGRVVGISSGSGHYAPSAQHLVMLLEMLETQGVPARNVEVWLYPHAGVTSAMFKDARYRRAVTGMDARMAEFIRSRVTVQKLGAVYFSRRAELDVLRKEQARFSNLKFWLQCRGKKKSGLPVETCTCLDCRRIKEEQKVAWADAEPLRQALKREGRLTAEWIDRLVVPLNARAATLEDLPSFALLDDHPH